MAWRFKASKYKNASPKFPKKEEIITELPVTDVTQSCGNHIKASCVYSAFNIDSAGGGNVGFLPHSAIGRQGASLPVIYAHGDFVTDLDFSPFDDYLLATGSQDNKVNLWLLPDENNVCSLSDPVTTLPAFPRRVENVLWNPQADGILAVTSNTTVKIFNVTGAAGREVFDFSNHGDQIQSVSWKGDGSLLVTSCKDKKIRVIDPRANSVVQEGSGHQNVKDSRVLWLGEKEFILSTGFSQARTREVRIWDPRNLASYLTNMDIDSSTGTIMPFFDPDTNMTFLIGKGDTTLNFLEFTEKEPYLTSAGVDRTEQIKGAALVPKRAVALMDGEVNRLLVLSQRTITHAPYIVPRKSYRDFHSDLYPDTQDGIPGLSADQWIAGHSAQVTRITLQPGKQLIRRERRGSLIHGSQPDSRSQKVVSGQKTDKEKNGKVPAAQITSSSDSLPKQEKVNQGKDSHSVTSSSVKEEVKLTTQKPNQNSQSPDKNSQIPDKNSQIPDKNLQTPKPVKPFAGIRQSKFRHIQGSLLHPSSFITNIRNVCKTIPGESNVFAANTSRCAVPIDGPGGCIQVFEFDQACRLQDTGVPVLQNGSKVTDFAWDPFDNSRLLVALDNAKINVWRIPKGGITEELVDEPEFSLRGHTEKIYFIRFHPLASDLIATASYDMTVRLWDLKQQKEVMRLEDHEDQVFCLSWSSDGKFFATVSKDGKVRVFEPRKSSSAIRSGPGPEGSRGARIEWALQDRFLVVSGFDKSSLQQLLVYRSDELRVLHRVDVHVSPAILVSHYDPDTSVLFLSSRGDRIIYTFEVAEEEPYLFECAPFKLESVHQGVSYLPKHVCDVRKVEVARAWRLTSNSVEALSFTVPRVKPEFFQDDLFPDTSVTWEPTLTVEQWLAGNDKLPRKISLKPADMTALSVAPVEAPKVKKFESYSADTFKTDEQRKEELLSAVVGKLEISSEPLPQDLTEGVEADEW
ncbi:unnamed protein product, partial [Candidula unifasciata]